mmetsp:Transcript_19570/g.47393  ORF Transcript_19570/g.47393 Transcript_19570/m.47393 type:complete len:246 (+) Transcript_19570:1138-1875(+)
MFKLIGTSLGSSSSVAVELCLMMSSSLYLTDADADTDPPSSLSPSPSAPWPSSRPYPRSECPSVSSGGGYRWIAMLAMRLLGTSIPPTVSHDSSLPCVGDRRKSFPPSFSMCTSSQFSSRSSPPIPTHIDRNISASAACLALLVVAGGAVAAVGGGLVAPACAKGGWGRVSCGAGARGGVDGCSHERELMTVCFPSDVGDTLPAASRSLSALSGREPVDGSHILGRDGPSWPREENGEGWVWGGP